MEEFGIFHLLWGGFGRLLGLGGKLVQLLLHFPGKALELVDKEASVGYHLLPFNFSSLVVRILLKQYKVIKHTCVGRVKFICSNLDIFHPGRRCIGTRLVRLLAINRETTQYKYKETNNKRYYTYR